MDMPNLIDRLKLTWQFYKEGTRHMAPRRAARRAPLAVFTWPGEAKAAPFIWPAWRMGKPQWQIVNFEGYAQEGFNENAVIYSAIMYKVRSITIAPLRAYGGTVDEPELLPADHPLQRLAARPNRYMSWSEFQGLAEVYLNLAGNCYVYVEPDEGGGAVPKALWLLRPDRTYIVPHPDFRGKTMKFHPTWKARQQPPLDKKKAKEEEKKAKALLAAGHKKLKANDGDEKLLGFYYIPEGKAQADGDPYLPHQVIHIKLPNPLDPLDGLGYGLSPVSPMARSADVDNQVTKYLKLFFEKGAMPPGLLKFEVPMTDADVARARERWMEIYGGVDEMHKVAVLDQGGEYQRLGLSFNEMGFEVIDERNEARICCVPGTKVMTRGGLVPIEEVGIDDYVLTHKGRFRRVLRTFETPTGDRRVVKVQAKGLDCLEVTDNHPVLTARFSQTRSHRGIYEQTAWKKASELKPKVRNRRGEFDGLCMPKLSPDTTKREIEVINWLAPSRIGTHVKGDLLYHNNPTVRPIPCKIPLSPALGRLLGFYLAEGSTGDGKTLWYFHIDETEYQEQVLADLKEVFGVTGFVKERPEDNVAIVTIQNALIARFFSCGTARSKCLPEWAWDGDEAFRHSILMGWMKGDGHNSGLSWRGTTMSENLAWQMFLLGVSLDKRASVAQGYKPPSEIKGRRIPGGPYWRVAWRLDDVRQRSSSYNFHDGYWVSYIRSVEETDYDGPVYNLEVEEDNSYWTTGGTVHNCGPFGVPPILIGTRIGLGRATYANYQEARKAFWEDTMTPELRWFEVEYQYYLRGDSGEFVAFDLSKVPALMPSPAEKREAAATAFKLAGITRNEFRAAMGFSPVEGGDVYLIPMAIVEVPVGGFEEEEPEPETEEGAPGAQEQAEEEEAKAGTLDEETKAPERSRMTAEQKAAFWKQMDAQARSWEKRFGDAAAEAFEADKREILAIVGEAKAKALEAKQTVAWGAVLLAVQHYLRMEAADAWRGAFVPVITGLVVDRADQLNAQFGMEFDVYNVLTSEFLDSYLMPFTEEITDVTDNMMSQVFRQAMEDGASIPTIQQRLEDVFRQWMEGDLSPDDFAWFEQRMPAYRRELIARSESIRASGRAADMLYRGWGLQLKEWYSTEDGRRCLWCREMHGKIIKTGDSFWKRGDVMVIEVDGKPQTMKFDYEDVISPPLHCQCRCTLLPCL